MSDPVSELRGAVSEAAAGLRGDGPLDAAKLDRPPRADFGDYSTNAAMLLAPTLGEPPRAIAERLGETLGDRLGSAVEKVEIAGPGFLNLFMTDAWYLDSLAAMRAAGGRFGAGDARQRVQVEFVSANPTGPITVAAARHAAYGDSLARILELAGNTVEREYYVNDAGTQVRKFGEAIRARARGEEPEEYKGDYVSGLAERIPGAADADPDELAKRGIELMLEEIEATLQRFRVHMDRFFSERSLLESGAVERALDKLEGVYESEGALWLRTTAAGDDKDRVLRRSTGELAYFAPDIAYHADKLSRGYDRLINVLGSDHHGYVKRIYAAWAALGGDPGAYEIVMMQLVNLFEGGKRAQMSKREGAIVTLDALLDDIGVDAARWYLASRSHDTSIDLDLELARSQSQDNPVYYVQYAHARIALDPAQGGGGAGGRRDGRGPDRQRRALPPLGALARQAAARVPGRGGGGRRAPRAAPDDDLRARDGPGVLGLLPRLPRGRRGRGGRRRGRADRDLRARQGRARPLARPARSGGAGVDVGWRRAPGPGSPPSSDA